MVLKSDSGEEPAFYLFGYGSLIFNPNLPHICQSLGYILNHRRRLWQKSNDHRGTPEFPGRVFSLVPTEQYEKLISSNKDRSQYKKSDDEGEDGKVWGIVYGVSEKNKENVLKQLAQREKDGYTDEEVDVYSADGKVIAPKTMVFISNREMAVPKKGDGEEGWEELAQVIVDAEGDSGPNWEYVIKTRDASRKLGIADAHIDGVAAAVEKLREVKSKN